MGLSETLQKSTAMQKVLCAISVMSAFLPWMQINLIIASYSMDLWTLTIGGLGSRVLIGLGGALFMMGSVALLGWRKAPLLQVAGLIVIPVGFLTDSADLFAGFQALQMFTGVGVYVGWACALGGVALMAKGWPTPRLLQNALRLLPGRPHGRKVAALVARDRPAPAVQARSAGAPPMSFPAAIETAERHLAGGDLNAALTWYGRALGTSRGNEEKAISKVKIASVLRSLGKDQEAQMFIDEAREIDPEDVSGWSVLAEDRYRTPGPWATGA